MGQLLSMGSCPFCLGGKRTSCFATYDDGYKCFTCGKSKSGLSREYISKQNTSKPIDCPSATYNPLVFGGTVLKWLYSYYVFDDLIRKYKIGYVPATGSLEESLLFQHKYFWQQRFFPSKRFITGGSKDELCFIVNDVSNNLVLVEDFISAIRVAEYANVLCLWGVHVNGVMSKFIENIDMNILVWLDNDEAGQTAAKQLHEFLIKILTKTSKSRAFAIRESRTVEIIKTEKQPKEYCSQELKSILENVNVEVN